MVLIKSHINSQVFVNPLETLGDYVWLGSCLTPFGVDQKKPIVALFGDFGYSQNGGGTFSDFLIFFSPWLYLLITTSSSLKAAD